MKVISKGKMFLADQRLVTENEHIRRHSTFNFGNAYYPTKEPIGNLHTFLDDLLAPKASNMLFQEESGEITIIPVTGTVNLIDAEGNEAGIEVGKSITTFIEEGSFITLKNPYENENINYLIIGLKNEGAQPNSSSFHEIDLSTSNQLNSITPNSAPFKISLGRFNGRGENEQLLEKEEALYCYVLNGAFEIDGRLLHQNDGLALWETDKVEMEALSNNATLLTIAFPLQQHSILF